ncbi:sperm flagellar protein 2 isoform X5 [Elephas maximus indicus]|uniref:sperm flagellar protein 2 isoform X5 n=1 Tax=Elephas maximus indicus TaxID=99487 RepID=UPI002116AEC6|nr:sperm flagellar protein 2 isoform X5 [Elephas maximus indicus]
MSEILCQWLNQELKVSQTVSPKSFAKAFSSGYLIGEVLHKFELQDDFPEFSESRVSSAKLNNFSRLEPTLHLLGVQFDQNVAQSIITEKPGAATKLLYQLYIALQKKKKSGMTGSEMQTMQPLTSVRLQNMKSEAFRERLRNLIPRQTDFNLMRVTHRFQEKYKHVEEELVRVQFEKDERFQKLKEEQRCFNIEKQRLGRRRQNEIMAKIQAAIIQIPKPASNRTLKALEAQKMMKKKKEAEDVANEIKKFEALIKKDLQAKESASKTSLDTSGQMTTDLLNTYSDDEYIKKIQKRLEEDALAREQREKRRRRLLMDQLIAHEAQEEAYREEQLINRLMRQSQQERRIAVQLMHVRHEKEVLWQNRIFREKQYEERRLKNFQDALDREAALAKQAKIDFEEQALREKAIHEQIAVERAQARYQKHYSLCAEILDHILDLSTKVADYRMLTNNLIPYKLMHDWKELFFNGKPIYEQAKIKYLPAKPSEEQIIELEKRDLLDGKDYEEYKNMVGEWSLPEEMVDNLPPSNNSILGHVLHRLIEKTLPSQAESTVPEVPSFAIKGCLLGKTFSGKTTSLKSLQKDFPIQILSIDTLVQEAIQAFHDKEEVIEALPVQQEAEEKDLPGLQDSNEESQDQQNAFSEEPVSSEALPATEGTNTNERPKTEEVKTSDSFSELTVRAQLGAKSEKLLKKGMSIPDGLLVSIMVNAINQVPVDQGWILDGFPMTLNQAKLLEEALTGCNKEQIELEAKRTQISTLVVDPTVSKEVPVPPSALDFALLLDISDSSTLSRINDIMAEAFLRETPSEDISQHVAAENQDKDENQTLKDQIQHRIIGFLDNWPLLEQWFSEPENILIKVNADIDKESLCQRVKEIVVMEMQKKKNKVNKQLEEKEAEKKEDTSPIEAPPLTPPFPPLLEPEKEKEITPQGEASKTHPAKGKPQSGSPKGKTQGGKQPVKKSPTDSADMSPAPVVPPLPKPGSEEWVYVNEPIPEEIPSFLVPYWKLIESSYIKTIKTVLRHLREDQHTVIAYLYEVRTSFQHFLMRPDHKQDFVAHWQADFNSLPDDLWDDEETKAELHQRVNDLRDRLWDICDARKEEAEQERLDIINESWLQDSIGIAMNHFFSLMQAELSRFQDTKRLLQDYYRAMESKIPVEDNKKFIRVPLLQLDGKDVSENQLKIPLVPRISISPETAMSKPKLKTILKGKMDNSLENVELNFEADEKLVMDTWQQASLAISSMVAAEIHQKHMEEEKENQQVDTKEKPTHTIANKKAKKEPKKQKADKKTKGKSPPAAEASPVVVTPEEFTDTEKKNELRLKIKEEHLAALQCEEVATQFRLELIKTKALAFLEDLVTKVVDVYKLMEKWLGERYLNEMASVEKLTEVARYHIETSTRIQNELYLNQEDFFINGDIKVFPDSPPPIRPPPVEKEENGTLTIEQLDSLRSQFLDVAPKGRNPPDDVDRVTKDRKKLLMLDDYLPKRNNQFLKIWLKKYPWLVYDEILNLMFCSLCRKHGVKSQGSQVSFSYGTDNFRTEFLNAHHLSEAHAKASLMEATSGSPVNKAATELMVKTMSKVTLGRVENLFRSCHAIAKTGHSLKDFIWMCKLDDMKGVDIGPVFRTNKSARMFAYFIAEVERRNLREKLEKCKFFSVISDGVRDGSVEEAELVYVQFARAGKVHCQIVGVQTVEKQNPLAIKNAIEKTLEINLQLRLSSQDWAKKLVGFGSDGAPAMEAENNGVALLLREIQPCVQTVHCFAHRLELSYKAVFQSVPLYNHVRDLLHSIYHFYHHSPLHKSSLKTVFKGLHLQPIMPSQIGGRRWLHGLQAALQKFLKGYPAIAQQLHSNRNSSIADIFATLESTLEMLRMYQSRPGPKERRVDSVTQFHGNNLRGKGNISAVRNVVLTHLIKRLRGCFQDASQDVVKASTIGSFKLWPRKINQEFGEKEVSILIAHYEPVLEAANVKIDEVDTEWSMLKLEVYARFQNIRKLTWDFVNSVYLHKYPNILTLVDLVLSLPASSAEAERGFSQMKRTNSHTHVKTKAESMTDLLIIQLNSPDINNFNPKKAIHLWNTRTPSSAGIIGNKTFTDILLDLVTLNLGTNNFPSTWMHLNQPELQELTSLLIVNSEFVDWRKFLLLASLPWPIPLEEELLETLQRFKTVDEEQLGMVTLEQYMQAGLWFTGDEDIKIPENPLEPLAFNRQEHLIEFFFRLFADYEKDPPQLDYTQMLLYFACHPDTVEGVYRALSVAIGTHVFRRIKTPTPLVDKTFSFTDVGPVAASPEPEENIREERELKEEKEDEIPENANTEKISMETLLKVFQGGIEAQDCDRFASHLKTENIYYEKFIKIFQDLGAKNLEPIEVAVLLKHPFIQDLISNYSDYRMPDIKIVLQRSEHVQGSDGERSPSRLTEEKK